MLYCLNNVKIINYFLNSLHNKFKKINFNFNNLYSISSISLNLFQKKFNNYKLDMCHKQKFDQMIRPSFFGGKCEIYGNPFDNEKILHFDFNKMYKQSMLENFPCGKHKILTNNLNLEVPGFYSIEFESNLEYPILPHRKLDNNKLMFSNGKMTGIFFFEEILLFLNNGGKINKINYGITYENYFPVFKNFINNLDYLNDNEFSFFYKLTINSLFGRMGMDLSDTYSYIINFEDYHFYNNKYQIINTAIINNIALITLKLNSQVIKDFNIKKKNIKSNISIASAITAKARIRLYKAQQILLKSEFRLLYSDTDSIFVAYNKKINKNDLSFFDWKIDYDILDAVFISSKSYALKYLDKEIIRIKGLDSSIISFNDIKNKFYLEDDFIHYSTNLNKNHYDLINKITKKDFFFDYYDKRKFSLNKKFTSPFFYKNFYYL